MDAIVFDFDGVIVQSIEQHADAYADVLNPRGANVRRRDVLLREGARSETIVVDLLGDAGITPTPEEVAHLAEAKQAAFEARGKPSPYADALVMLEAAWKTGLKTAIVTGTRRRNLDALIPDWLPRFDAVVTQESYSNDKPHPEPYLMAAQQLNVAPGQCVVVENAIRGIQSGQAAGYGMVIGICTTLGPDDLAPLQPHVLAHNHHDVAEALAKL